MPRKKKPKRDLAGAEDKGLKGTWYRCADHGLTTAPIFMGAYPYCPSEFCSLSVKLVHSSLDDLHTTPQDWNGGGLS